MVTCSVGTKLREAREARGYRREAAAVAVDKSYQSIAAYESGLVEPPLHVLRELAKFYEVPLIDLLEEVPADEAA